MGGVELIWQLAGIVIIGGLRVPNSYSPQEVSHDYRTGFWATFTIH